MVRRRPKGFLCKIFLPNPLALKLKSKSEKKHDARYDYGFRFIPIRFFSTVSRPFFLKNLKLFSYFHFTYAAYSGL